MAIPILKEPPITTREALIPYAMTGLNMLMPVLAAQHLLYAPGVFIIAVGMTLLGLPVSIYFRQRQYNRYLLNIITMVPLLIMTWALLRTHPGLQIDWGNFPYSLMQTDSMDALNGMLHIFVLLAAGRAFVLVAPAELLQTPLPSICIFLLTVVNDRSIERSPGSLVYLTLLLMVLIVSSLYLFGQEQGQQWFSIHTPLRFQRLLVGWVVLIMLALFPVVALLGISLQPVNLQNMTRIMRARWENGHSWQFWQGGQVGFSFGQNIEMGGSNWPSGKQLMMTVAITGKPQFQLYRANTYAVYDLSSHSWQMGDVLNYQPLSPGGTANRNASPVEGFYTVTLNPKKEQGDPGLIEAIREKKINLDDKLALVGQKYSLEADTLGGIQPIFGIYQAFTVISDRRTVLNAESGNDSSIRLRYDNSRRRPLTAYEVTSIVKPSPATMKLDVEVPLPKADIYLDMPGGNRYTNGESDGEYARRVRKRALEILHTANVDVKKDPLAVVRQFEMYLGNNYRYTLRPHRPKNDEDPILDFLFTQKQGYCNYFSGAMVMLCRSVGIPARFVVGFASGEIDENKSSGDVSVFRVTSEDAHSWAEVYLPRYGWLTSDPTAGSQLVPSLWGSTWDFIINAVTAIKTAIADVFTFFALRPHLRGYLYLGLSLLCVLLAALIIWRRERPPAFPKTELSDEQARAVVLTAYRRMHRWLRMWGVEKPNGLTATEFDMHFRSLSPSMGEPVSELTRLYLHAEYGVDTLHDADARQAITLLHQLWALAPAERRRIHAENVEA